MSLLVLSEDFGLVWMYAYGLRKEKSKLRFSLQVGSHVECALVQGKAGWQVVNALLLDEIPTKTDTYDLLLRLNKVLKRVVPQSDETGGYEIYKELKHTLQTSSAPEEVQQATVFLGAINILGIVGYGLEHPLSQNKQGWYEFSEKNISYILQNQIQINKDIKDALHASQL